MKIFTDRELKLHLGCGMCFIPGFIHVDIIKAPHIDYSCSVEKLTPFEDNSVDLIYASHVLEHFGRKKILDVLSEWHLKLKPGGKIRIAVPDFAAVVKLYDREGLGDGQSGLLGLVCGGQRDENDFHKIIFDEPYLNFLLHKVGFKNIERWNWQLTEHAHIDDFSQAYIPHMDKQNGQLMSLNLEGLK